MTSTSSPNMASPEGSIRTTLPLANILPVRLVVADLVGQEPPPAGADLDVAGGGHHACGRVVGHRVGRQHRGGLARARPDRRCCAVAVADRPTAATEGQSPPRRDRPPARSSQAHRHGSVPGSASWRAIGRVLVTGLGERPCRRRNVDKPGSARRRDCRGRSGARCGCGSPPRHGEADADGDPGRAGGLPERGTVIVPVGHDGSARQRRGSARRGDRWPDQAGAGGGRRRAQARPRRRPVPARGPGRRPRPAAAAGQGRRCRAARPGGGWRRRWRRSCGRSRCARRVWPRPTGSSLGLPPARGGGSPGPGCRAACLSLHRNTGPATARTRTSAGPSACGSRSTARTAADRGDAVAGGGGLPGARPGQRARQRPDAQGVRRRLRRARRGRARGRDPRPSGADPARHERAAGRGAGQRRSRPSSRSCAGRAAAARPPLALVGKGVCFDTGGISIKPAQGMEEMKADMGGAAAVFGAMLALAGRKARANVVGVVGLVENMPSANAQRPGDVVRSMAGKTIEVVNTDAEGRLVLATCSTTRGAVQAQGDDRPRHAHRCGHRGAGPRAGRPVRNDETLAARSDRPPPARPASCSGGCRWARPTRSTSSPTSPTSRTSGRGARGRQHGGCRVPAAVRRRHALGASRHRRHGLELARPAARRQGRHRLRRAPARPAGRRPVRSGRLTEVGFYHLTRSTLERGAAAPAGEGLCRAASACVVRVGDRRAARAAQPRLVDLRQGQLPAARHARGRLRRGPADLPDRRRSRTPNGATILVLVDGAAAPDLGRVRPLPRPVRRRRPRSGRARPRALARGPGGRAMAATYWQQSERGGWVRAGA